MIDIHCHILPAFDDGAQDIREAMDMARMAADSGVEAIIATPHFPGEAEALAQMPRLLARYRRLSRELKEAGIPIRLFPGAEILCARDTVELARQHQLPTLSNTDYLLVEFFFSESLDYMTHQLSELAACGYKPVVAHPERYEAVQEDPLVLQDWFRRGWVIQLNKGSLLGAFGPAPERTAHWALERGLVHIIASDAHSALRRTPEMSALHQLLQELCPPAYVRLLLRENPLRLLKNLPMADVE